MGLFSWFFRKRNQVKEYFEPVDEQEQFLKDDITPRKKKSAKKVNTKQSEASKKVEPSQPDTKVVPKADPEEVKESSKANKPVAKAAEKDRSIKNPASEKASTEKTKSKKADNEKNEEKKPERKKPKAKLTEGKKAKSEDIIEGAPELMDDSPEVKDAVAVQESKSTANGKFDIRRAKDGRYFFSLYASNHMVIAYSQIYSSTSGVNTGINSVISNAPKAATEDTTLQKVTSLPYPKWEIYIDKAGEYRFRLYASNGLCVCHSSHGYATKSGCKGGIESIKRFSAEARVDKSYLTK